MPNVIINDEACDMEPGERLLDVARRNTVHIGFSCDGNGLCQMCECTVLKGADSLSPPNEVEEIWLTPWQLEHGRRLACQASLRGGGAVEVLTRAEELRRQTIPVLRPPEGGNQQEHWNVLWNNLVTMSIEHTKRFPQNMIYTMVQLFTLRPTLTSARQAFLDAVRITQRMINIGLEGGGATPPPPPPPTAGRLPAPPQPPAPMRPAPPTTTRPDESADEEEGSGRRSRRR
jgi:ferredoxin